MISNFRAFVVKFFLCGSVVRQNPIMGVFYNLLARVFIFIAVGWLLQKLLHKKFEAFEKAIINFVYYFVVPFFIFVSMLRMPAEIGAVWRIILSSVFVVFGCGILAFLFSISIKTPFRNVVLPISIMNSAYLAIPANTVLFGSEGAFWAIIYNISVTIIHFTIGILIVKNGGVAQIRDMPAIYAIILGFIFKFVFGELRFTAFLKDAYYLISQILLPIMLVFMGMKLSGLKFYKLKDVLIGVFLRMAGGFLLGILALKIFELSGAAAGVCMLTSTMPSAINTYIVAKKFNADPEFASGMIICGILASIAVIPLVFLFISGG